MAVACSVALHEILAGFIHPVAPAETPRETVEHVTIARVERKPRPTPTPTPSPTPKPVRVLAHSNVISPNQQHSTVALAEGKSAHKEIVKRSGAARPKPPHVSHAKPIWDIPVGAQGAGAGKGEGAGSLGNGGNGTGAGNAGEGPGGGGGPCGFVEFSARPGDIKRLSDGTQTIDVRMTVHYSDNSTQTIQLDYPFHYENDRVNPFSVQNLSKDMLVPFQTPPPELAPNESPVVQYVIKHSTPDGRTLLQDCPSMLLPSPTPPNP